MREPDEWEEGVIDPAILLSQGEFYSGAAVNQLSLESPVILYCRSGQRSANCAVALTKAGFTDVASLDGGMTAWDALKV